MCLCSHHRRPRLRDTDRAKLFVESVSGNRNSGRMTIGMIKEIGDGLKGLAEFLASPKRAAVLFISSAAWVFQTKRVVLPFHGMMAEYAGLVASICFTFSGAYL